jgi:putative zinc finger/helix-turn-helix YgiT family protein
MRCPTCGETLGKAVPGSVEYQALPGITLAGVPIRTCGNCGDQLVSIPRIEELDQLITTMLAKRPGRLNRHEIRFLRKQIGWSGADFARHFGVTAETVSRWENGKKMDVLAEKLLRLCATSLEPIRDYEQLEAFLARPRAAAGRTPRCELRWRPRTREWAPLQAAAA